MAPRPKKANGYTVMTEKVKVGEVLQDLDKQKWVVGQAIGQGGFGVIYSANAESKTKNNPYVVKFEPRENGPLFVERNYYLKSAKQTEIEKWVKERRLPYLGLPRYLGSGSHEIKGVSYRFLVTDRFGTNLWTKFEENQRRFPLHTILRIALQTLNVLEYIHNTGYIHCDVKGSNLVLGFEKSAQDRVFLIDYGLVTKFTTNAEYKPDPRTAHNGTIEYLSRDAHDGVASRRGDLEVLGFNMLHWLAGTLPWEKAGLSQAKKKEVEVQNLKINFMSNIAHSLKAMKLDKPAEAVLLQYLSYVKELRHDGAPDYQKVRSMLQKALKETRAPDSGPLVFSCAPAPKTSPKRAAPARGRAKKAAVDSDEESDQEEPQPKVAKGRPKKPAAAAAAAVDCDEEEKEYKCTSCGKKERAKKAAAAARGSGDSDDEEAAQNGASARPNRGRPVAHRHSDTDEEEPMEVDQEEEEEAPAAAAAKKPKAKRLGRSALAKLGAASGDSTDGGSSQPAVPKWKQCATAQASNVERPGEYTRQTGTKPRPAKK